MDASPCLSFVRARDQARHNTSNRFPETPSVASLNVGMIGYGFMGRARGNACRPVAKCRAWVSLQQ